MTISRVKFPWPPFFRIFIFFHEAFISVCGTTYLMRDDGATDVNGATLKCKVFPPKPYGPGVTAERALLLFEELQSSPARPVGSCSGPAASADAHLPRRAHELGSGGAAAGKLRKALTVVRPP